MFCSWDLGLKTTFQIHNPSLKNRKEIEVFIGMVFFGVCVVSYSQNELLVDLLQQKNLKNINLTGNLTWNWCLSFGICQYYSRNMFHCRASWDYDPFTQFVKIPQIHSTLFLAAVWGIWGLFTEAASKPFTAFYFHGGQDLNLIPENGWWQIRPHKSVLGKNGRCCTSCFLKSRSDNGLGVFFVDLFLVPAWWVKRDMSWIMRVNWKTFVICKI